MVYEYGSLVENEVYRIWKKIDEEIWTVLNDILEIRNWHVINEC